MPSRRKRLLRHFGSVQRIREAGVDALAQVRGISTSLAARIKSSLGESPVEPQAYSVEPTEEQADS